ncbi:MAG: 16S rRNA (cytosine(967)-C(5))-methyltransferase [Gammaproteobacteria bacterium RIFCSPHIGHO2_12_FULL_37_14]|nr:MAG: 16S rRNA (cytosine(967)-C(5))-methyltransferase [Gammaproteobacteria bacterium RIFCSPHIGHO2_12_FULL_37_14]
MSNSRVIAAQIIHHVIYEGKSLTDSLNSAMKTLDQRDRAFVQAICYGVCRYYSRLAFILNLLLKKPISNKESIVYALLLVGLYQLTEMHTPQHAAVAETVEATLKLKKPWARGLVNAILREYLRREQELNAQAATNLEANFLHPQWWIAAIQQSWPQHWQTILQENNAQPPFTLRVNLAHKSREKYINLLENNGYVAYPIPETTSGIVLESALPVEKLPGFDQGDVSVQDGGAQLAAELLDLKPGLRVLDACAAPGGKFMHILEMESELSTCVAIEKDFKRMLLVRENLLRLFSTESNNSNISLLCHDATDIASWWDKQPFDRILLDAPCSASGVIRRHPDIKLLRKPNDIRTLAAIQRQLLNKLWLTLKPSGLLLYVTCSIFPEENAQLVQEFLSAHLDAQEEKLTVSWGLPATIGRQIIPGMHGMDGFYFAKIKKIDAAKTPPSASA